MKIKNAYIFYKKYGLKYTISLIINYFFSKIGILSEVELLKIKINKDLSLDFKNTVLHGVFKGMKLSDKVWWGKYDIANKLFGQYEAHVVNKIIELSLQNNLFIDIGAADGYFAIGMVYSGFFEKAICFEISEKGRLVIEENASVNNVSKKIIINGIANSEEIDKIISKNDTAVVLIDIEGAEFDLLTYDFLYKLRNCTIIIELHDTFISGLFDRRQKLFSRASQFFNLNYIKRSSPEINSFSELNNLNDSSRFLLFSEGRPNMMDWVCFSPKKTYN
jgi:hypothetical protein